MLEMPAREDETMRKCYACDVTFTETKEKSELVQFCDHVLKHQPTPEQWHNAYKILEAGKERAKAKARADEPE